MTLSQAAPAPEAPRSRAGRFWPPLLIAAAGLAAYANSFSGPFVYDDVGAIPDNPSIRHVWALGRVFSPPPGFTVSGRPILNLSFAINYAISGTQVWSYHALNLLIHICAGLTLFGIVRRTLERFASSRIRKNLAPESSPICKNRAGCALAIALIWTLHPLQTEAVTYIVQRAESLMGLFYLLTLYCFVRYAEDKKAGRWVWGMASVLACFFGMGVKEVMVSAPVIVLLYDRTFVSGTFRESLRRHRSIHLGLACSWIFLGWLVVGSGGGRAGSAGLGSGVSFWDYGLTQFEAIARYLMLAVWPHPLAFDYGTFWVTRAWQVVPYACVVAPLVAAVLVALRRWPVWGFLGFWFFAILAPTSLVPGVSQMIVEHRLYLALAPLLAAIACAGCALTRQPAAAGAWVAALLVFAGVCGILTACRNDDYRSELILWADTAAKRPENALAHNNLGTALEKMPGRLNDAIAQYREAVRLKPDYARAHNNLGNAWLSVPGRLDDAVAQIKEALRLKPDFAEAYNNLGKARALTPGGTDDAIAQFGQALRLNPDFAEAHNNLGNALLAVPGRLDEAIAQYREALRLMPDFAEAHNDLGNALLGAPGRLDDAIAQYREAIRLKPDYAEAHFNLAVALLHLPDRVEEAKVQLETFLRLRPGNELALQVLARLQ